VTLLEEYESPNMNVSKIHLDVGVILRGQRNMNTRIWDGTSWFYDARGAIWASNATRNYANVNAKAAVLQDFGSAKIRKGDKITVTVKEGKISFAVNGELQGCPIPIPAVTICGDEACRFGWLRPYSAKELPKRPVDTPGYCATCECTGEVGDPEVALAVSLFRAKVRLD